MKKTTKIFAVMTAAACMGLFPAYGNGPAVLSAYAAESGWTMEGDSQVYYDEDGYLVTDSWRKNGEDWFYLGDPKDNFIYNLEGVNSGTTYAYYDMDDNCLGYAQTRIMETDGLEHDWYIVFLDADGNIRADYLTDERCHYVMDFDGNVLGTCSATEETFSDKYEVKVQMNEGEQMDLMDKVAICRQLAHWYAFDHSY